MSGPFDLEPRAWARLRRLLADALPLDSVGRTRFLAELGPEDAPLVPRLRALLRHAPDGEDTAPHDGDSATAARLLQTLPKVDLSPLDGQPPTAAPGQQVGPYRLTRELGRGGMASVWLAERTDVLQGRLAAVKLPLGAWHGAGLAERLGRERAILATLNHPHIATLYDAGVDPAGRPWLALEYVEGERLDAHCDRLELGLRARLALFLQVARAVAHAHAHLVVHRDLKPSNILVTAEGRVKLLDFGVAKLLQEGLAPAEASELTHDAGRPLTPDYAAPEQLRGQPVGTAADVYALGVVLYELVAGTRPYALTRGPWATLGEAIAEVRPPPPSVAATARAATWRRALRGDLDTIVGKAMKPGPDERYATVAALADDVQRHLDGAPVAAQPDRLGYRLRKFVARHRLGVGASAVALTAVLAGAGAAVWQARIARAEQRRAEDVKAFIAAVFEDADPWHARPHKPSVAELLQRARGRVGAQFAASPPTHVELLTIIGASLTGLEEYAEAEQVLREAAAIAQAALPPTHALRLRAHHHLLRLYGASQRAEPMKVELSTLLPALRALEADFGAELVEAWVSQVQVDNDEGRYADMETSAREALAVAARRLPLDHPMRVLATRALANALENQGKLVEARRESTAAFELSSRLFEAEPQHPLHNETRFIHARILSAAGDHEAALPLMRQSIAVAEGVVGPDSLLVATMVREMVSPLMETHRLREGLAASERALAVLRRHHADDSLHLAYARVARGTILRELRRDDIGRGDFEAAVRVLVRELGADHGYTLDGRAAAAHARALGGDPVGAAEALDQVVQRFEASGQPVLPKVTIYRALAYRLSGRPAEALGLLQPLLKTSLAPRERSRAQQELAEVLLAMGQPGPALELLRQQPAREATQRPSHAEVDLALGRALLGTGQVAQAVVLLRRVDDFWRGFEPDHRLALEAATWLRRGQAALRHDGQ